jgi:hypothetical protein
MTLCFVYFISPRQRQRYLLKHIQRQSYLLKTNMSDERVFVRHVECFSMINLVGSREKRLSQWRPFIEPL